MRTPANKNVIAESARTPLASLVRAAINEANPSHLRRLRKDWLRKEEVAMFDFIKQHMSRHADLPNTEAFRAAGFALPTTVSEAASYYTERLRHGHAFRLIADRAGEFTELMHSKDVEGVVSLLREMLSSAGNVVTPDAHTTAAATIAAIRETYEDAKAHPGLRGITLGYNKLDNMTSGAQAGDVTLLAGTLGMGKSWLMNEIAYKQWLSGKRVAIVTMEMSSEQLVRRWVGRHSRINPNFIRAGQLSEWAESTFYEAAEQIERECTGVFILQGDFKKSMAGVEAFVAETNPDMLWIDGAYLLTSEGRKQGFMQKWENIADISSEAKQLSISAGIPIGMVVQMKSAIKKTTDRVADPTEIGGSIALAQDASLIVAMRRGVSPHELDQRMIDLIKNREGEVGSFAINYQHSPVNMDEVTDEQEQGFESNWMLA